MNAGPRRAEDRLGRLLVMLPWLMEQDGETPLADVAARYDMTEAQVQKDLELVAMCGLPPFVDEMIDVFVDDGMVFVGVPRLFTRPLRLTAPEGFSLLAAGRAAMELPGADEAGPLGRGLAKLSAALVDAGLPDAAGGADATAGVAIDMSRPPHTDEIAEAAATDAEVTIEYYSPSRDEVASRTIVPRHVFTDVGNWYVVADDERSGERRTFRIDRIESMVPTGRSSPTDRAVDAPGEFFTADVERAVLQLAPAAQWVLEQYPVDEVKPMRSPKGWVQVRLPMSSERWLARLVIRLGPHVRVREPASGREAAAELARAMLDRY